jgi:hypothetical protein
VLSVILRPDDPREQAFPLLQGRLEAAARVLSRDPVALLSVALPYVLAGAMLGWLTATPRHALQRTV